MADNVVDLEDEKARRIAALGLSLPAMLPWEIVLHGPVLELRIGTLQLVISPAAAKTLAYQLLGAAQTVESEQ